MDDLVLHIQKEVALDGESGCSWNRFWYLVNEFMQQKNAPSVPPATSNEGSNSHPHDLVDERFRQYFWNNFKEEDGILFYRVKADAAKEHRDLSRAFAVSIQGANEFSDSELDYQKMTDDSKACIRIVASVEKQHLALLGNSGNGAIKSDVAMKTLSLIAASREVGMTQTQLAKDQGIDPRSMFHFVKVLIDQGFIIKIPVTTGGSYTLLCLHKDFAHLNSGFNAMNSEETTPKTSSRPYVATDNVRFEGLLKSDSKGVSFYSAYVKQTITELLSKAKSQVMVIEDLARALDLGDMTVVQNRWFHRQIELLCRFKYIKRVHTPGHARCVQLLKLYGSGTIDVVPDGEKANLKAFMSDESSQGGVCFDTCLEEQVYQTIINAGSEGIIAKEIRKGLNKLNRRLLAKILDGLTKPSDKKSAPLVKRVVEFVGRERRYRYYSELAFTSTFDKEHKDYIDMASQQKQNIEKARPNARTKAKNSTTAVAEKVVQPQETPTSDPSKQDAENSGTPATATEEVASTSQQQSPNGSFVLSPMPATGVAAAPEKFLSIALLQRRKVLLKIMEERRMVEVQATLVAEFQRQKNIMFPDTTDTITDRRTIFRTVSILESEGLLKLYRVQNVPLLTGGTVTKTFCLLPDIQPDSEEVKQFVKESSSRHLIFGGLANKPIKAIERVDVEAESLDAMATRLGSELEKSINIPFTDLNSAKVPHRQREDARKSRLHVLGCDFEGSNFAIHYGWFRAKMLRALVFHRFILDKLTAKDKTLYPWADRPNLLSSSPLIELMPLRVYLQVVGITVEPPSPECREFLEANKGSNMPMHSLPSHSSFLGKPSPNFTKRCREAFEILDALRLLSPVDESCTVLGNVNVPLKYADNHLVFHTHYEIYVHVKAPLDPITPDDLDANLEMRKKYNLTVAKECRDFWVDLQLSASVMKHSGEIHLKHKTQQTSWELIRRSFLQNLCNKRIWTDPIRVTVQQQQVLLSYTNQRTMFVPIGNDELLTQIAQESLLAKAHIIRFYRALQASWKRSSREAEEKKTTGGRTIKSTRLRQVRVKTLQPKSTASTSLPESDSERRRALYGIDDGVDRRSLGARPKRPFKRRVRTTWTDEQTDILLLSCVVVRYIAAATRTRFSWHAPARALRGVKSLSVCRHRYERIVRNSVWVHRMEYFRMSFGSMYPEIIQKFELNTNLTEFDPLPIVKYLQSKEEFTNVPMVDTLMEGAVQTPRSSLKARDYILRAQEPFACLYVEERVNREDSWRRQLYQLSQLPITMRSMNPKELDAAFCELRPPTTTALVPPLVSHTESSVTINEVLLQSEPLVQSNIILTIIRSVFASPMNNLTLSWTRYMLEMFETKAIESSCMLGKEWKVLSSVRSRDLRIPGQKVGRSERFANVMAGSYRRIVSLDAAAMAKTLEQRTSWMFDDDSNASDMMVLANNVAMDTIKLSPAEPYESTVKVSPEAYFRNQLLNFTIKLQNMRHRKSLPSIPAKQKSLKRIADSATVDVQDNDDDDTARTAKRSKPADIDVQHEEDKERLAESWTEVQGRTEVALEKYLCTVPDDADRSLLKDIYRIALATKNDGVTDIAIKDALGYNKTHTEDGRIRQALKTLQSTTPPILMLVGMTVQRYVVFGWHEQWTVNYKRGRLQMEGGDGYDMKDGIDPMEWENPRMWRTVDPESDKRVFERTLHAVLTTIAERPGITKGTIQRRFFKVLNAIELTEVMDELEKRQAITLQFGIEPKPATLFSKRGLFKSCDRDTIHERMVTSYQAAPDYYKYLKMDLIETVDPGVEEAASTATSTTAMD
ncbi:RNA polymerase III transcription initiation factor complex subunit [Podila epigama]|nr:RNA polymerase III transcription initiation factor complex subunit [Podila epigama]